MWSNLISSPNLTFLSCKKIHVGCKIWFQNIGTNPNALAQTVFELRLFEWKAKCFLGIFYNFLSPFGVIIPYFRPKFDFQKGCKIQFWKHWDQSQPCSLNGFQATAVWTQGGNLDIRTEWNQNMKNRHWGSCNWHMVSWFWNFQLSRTTPGNKN